MPPGETPSLTTSSAADSFSVSPRSAAEPLPPRLLSQRLSWLLAWGTKGGLAAVDQGLFAGSHFVVNVLLARWLSPADYGAFVVAYSVFLLVSAVHVALLIEPMMVFGPGRYFPQRKGYLGILLRVHCGTILPVMFLLLAAGFLVGRTSSLILGHALSALALALPVILLVWLMRRAFYIEMQPGWAAGSGAIYLLVVVLSIYGLHGSERLTPATSILAMAAAAALTAVMQFVWLRPQWSFDRADLTPRDVALAHWSYGRWLLAAAFPAWVLLNSYYLILPGWFSLKEAGALKAIVNLGVPATNAFIAGGVLAIPRLVRRRISGGLPAMQQTLRSINGLFLGSAACYFVILFSLRVPIIRLLYDGKYLEYSGLPVLLAGLVPLVTACTVTFGVALRSLERPDLIFWANALASVISLTLGVLAVATGGVLGALAAYLLSYSVFAAGLLLFYRRLRLREDLSAADAVPARQSF